jgi:protein-arginine kinase activator protein McsA
MDTTENNINLEIIENLPVENVIESPNENTNADKVVKKITSEKMREYYLGFKDKNKDKINQKVDCEICGGSFTYFNKSRHLTTKRCLKVKELRGL